MRSVDDETEAETHSIESGNDGAWKLWGTWLGNGTHGGFLSYFPQKGSRLDW
jgi:hypothetical protein